jgi:hypothetical protein
VAAGIVAHCHDAGAGSKLNEFRHRQVDGRRGRSPVRNRAFNI